MGLCLRAQVTSYSLKMKWLILGIGSEISLQFLFILDLSSQVQLYEPGLWPPNFHSYIIVPNLSAWVLALY